MRASTRITGMVYIKHRVGDTEVMTHHVSVLTYFPRGCTCTLCPVVHDIDKGVFTATTTCHSYAQDTACTYVLKMYADRSPYPYHAPVPVKFTLGLAESRVDLHTTHETQEVQPTHSQLQLESRATLNCVVEHCLSLFTQRAVSDV